MAEIPAAEPLGTGCHALGCKWSAVDAGYVEDDFIRHFTTGENYGPLHNMLHYLRITSIRIAIRAFIEQFPDEAVQVVNFGCGFDSLAFWILQHYPNAACFELDRPEILQRKAELMKRAKPIMDLLPDYKDDGDTLVVTRRYKMVPCDFNSMADVEALVSKYHIARDQPTLFLTECALIYVEVARSNAIIKFASHLTRRPSCFVYWEQARTEDKFGQQLVQRFRESGYELLGPVAYPTIDSQIKRYTDLGWDKVAVMDMNTFYNVLISDEEKIRIKKLECLDEVEEIVIVCSHYVIGICGNQPEKLTKLFDTFTQSAPPRLTKTYTTEEVRDMIKKGTLSQMQPSPLNTAWLS